MIKKTFLLLLLLSSGLAYCQKSENEILIDSVYKSIVQSISFEHINESSIYENNTYIQKIDKLKSKLNKNKLDNHSVYFDNVDGSEYLRIYNGTDIGYGKFYSVGYTNDKLSLSNAESINIQSKITHYITDKNIRLGESKTSVWEKAQLQVYMSFKYKGVEYYYLYKNSYINIPPKYQSLYYFKFKNDKLIEFGLGYDMGMTNPMLQPE